MSGRLRLTAAGRALLGGAAATVLGGALAGAPAAVALAACCLALLVWTLAETQARGQRLARLRVTIRFPEGQGARRLWPLRLDLDLARVEGGRPLPVTLRLRVTGEPGPLPERALLVPGGARGTLPFTLRFAQAGHWAVHGVELTVPGPLGLAVLDLYRPDEHALTITPATPAPRAEDPPRRPAPDLLPVGENRTRRPGDGGELLELRDYVPGDPVRAIAWKATARRGRPLVRQTEEVRLPRLHLLLAIGPTMRAGPLGGAPLDRAIDLCDALIAQRGAHPLGLTTFDHRVYGHLAAGRGGVHRQRLRRHLLDLHRVVDDDLTEIAAGELLSRVGTFFERQARLAVRRPGAGEARALRSTVDPLAEQFDPGRLYEAVTTWLAGARDPAHAALFAKARPARDTFEARLRLFCALRSIPLPYRITGPDDAAERGLHAAAVRLMTGPPCDEIRLYTDLAGLSPEGVGLRALRGLAARKPHLVVAVPGAPEPALAAALRGLRARIITF